MAEDMNKPQGQSKAVTADLREDSREDDADKRGLRKLIRRFARDQRKADLLVEAERALTEHQKQHSPFNWETIAKEPGWTLKESAAYIYDPYHSFNGSTKIEWHERSEIVQFLHSANRAIVLGDLEAHESQDHQLVRPKTLLVWAKDNGFEIPVELDKAVAQFGIDAPRDPKQSSRVQNVAPYPSPPGLTWEEITLNLRSNELIEIVIREKRTLVTFSDMGFRNRTKGDVPDAAWGALIVLASRSGEVLARDAKNEGFVKEFKSKARDIRKRLRAYFQIEDDPFHPYKQSPQGYKTKFNIEDARQDRESSGLAPSVKKKEDWSDRTPEEFYADYPELASSHDDDDYR